jgi:hypothetical protein
MKLSTLILLVSSSCASAFAPSCGTMSSTTTETTTALSMSNRRAFLGSAAVAAAGAATVGLPVQSALALGDYVPKFDDLKQIYQLGVTLDRLKDSVQNDQGKALAGLVAFNREPDFYSGYARNYISKSVKNNADGDSRVGKIRQACGVISSCQGLLEGREGIEVPGPAGTEAVKRVTKAQSLIGQFLTDSGVTDERITEYVAKHQ